MTNDQILLLALFVAFFFFASMLLSELYSLRHEVKALRDGLSAALGKIADALDNRHA
jgi:hypothetical protein